MGRYFTCLSWVLQSDSHAILPGTVLGVSHIITIIMIGVESVFFSVDGEHTAVIVDAGPVSAGITVDLIAFYIVQARHVPVFRVVTGRGAVTYRDVGHTVC